MVTRMILEVAMPTVSGWPTRETWIVYTWLTNDIHLYRASRILVQQAPDPQAAADALSAWVERSSPLADQANMYADLLTAALGHVAWDQVALQLRDA
jgi:hypothetical protein